MAISSAAGVVTTPKAPHSPDRLVIRWVSVLKAETAVALASRSLTLDLSSLGTTAVNRVWT